MAKRKTRKKKAQKDTMAFEKKSVDTNEEEELKDVEVVTPDPESVVMIDSESEETPQEESSDLEPEEETIDEDESSKEEPSADEPENQMIELVYLGLADKSTVVGKVSGIRYEFYKDHYGMPKASSVDERDVSSIVVLKGKACCGKIPDRLFATKVEWDVELQEAKRANK